MITKKSALLAAASNVRAVIGQTRSKRNGPTVRALNDAAVKL